MDIDHGNRQRLAFPATALNAVLDRTRRITVGRPDLVEVGPVLLVFALEPPIELPAQITSIVTTTVREVTDEPTPDQDLAAAAAALLVEHPDLGANDPVAVVRFKVVQSWQLWRALEHHRPGPGSLWMDWRALRRHEELAPLVREELTAAGFVVAPEFPSRRSGSSGVSVEPSEEGVYVAWHVGETLRAASRAIAGPSTPQPATCIRRSTIPAPSTR